MSLNNKLEDIKIEEIKANWDFTGQKDLFGNQLEIDNKQKLLLHLLEIIEELKVEIDDLKKRIELLEKT